VTAAAATTAILAVTILLQAARPARRLVLVASGAALSSLVLSLEGTSTTGRLLAGVPWDVLVLLVGLGLVTEVLVASRLFGLLAVRVARATRAAPRLLAFVLVSGMYAVSGLVNNLTALMLLLPVVLILFRLMGVSQRYVTWTLGTLLVACNLGGAATPIGDFPAILLLGRGAMEFGDYLVRAAPLTLAALAALLAAVFLLARPEKGLSQTPLSARLTVATLTAFYRGVRLDRRALLAGLLPLAGMVAAWLLVPASTGVGPELICWIGAGTALLAAGGLGERLARTRVDVEATLFLLFLFVMVGAVGETGVFQDAARLLASLPLTPKAQVAAFLVSAALLTGVFSAGPSMAALLPVADVLAREHPPEAVYVGLALSVCAGSSLFLTAATAGPLTQALVERAGLRGEDGAPVQLGFFRFAPVGLLGFGVTLAVGLVATLARL